MLKKKKYNTTDNTWHKVADDKNVWIKWRFNIIRELFLKSKIDLNKNFICADIGAGKGNFSNRMESISNFSVDQFDIEKRNKKKFLRGKYYVHDIKIKNKKFKNKYDIIFLLDVLEHIQNDSSFIRDCKFYLKKNGFLILNVPSIPLLFSKYDHAVGHIRRYNTETLSKVMDKNKLKIVRMYYWGFLLVPLLFIRTTILTLFEQDKKSIIKRGMETSNIIVKKILEILFFLDFYIIKFRFFGSSIIALVKK